MSKEKRECVNSAISRCTNSREIDNLDDKALIQCYLDELRDTFQSNPDMAKLAALSAEFNGIRVMHDQNLTRANEDKHYLLYTDTFLGKEVATHIAGHLRHMKIPESHIVLKRMDHINIASSDDFRRGIGILIGWIGDHYQQWKDEGYEVIFHLTGGFKILYPFTVILCDEKRFLTYG